MPLSEHEQRLLEEMERNLYSAESDEVSADDVPHAFDRMAVVLGVIAAVIGLGVMLLGVWTKLVIVGVLGFLLIVGGVLWATAPRSGQTAPKHPGRESGADPRAASRRAPRWASGSRIAGTAASAADYSHRAWWIGARCIRPCLLLAGPISTDSAGRTDPAGRLRSVDRTIC